MTCLKAGNCARLYTCTILTCTILIQEGKMDWKSELATVGQNMEDF